MKHAKLYSDLLHALKRKPLVAPVFTVQKTFSSASAVLHRGLFQREDGSENLLEEILAWKYRRTRGKEGDGGKSTRGKGKIEEEGENEKMKMDA